MGIVRRNEQTPPDVAIALARGDRRVFLIRPHEEKHLSAAGDAGPDAACRRLDRRGTKAHGKKPSTDRWLIVGHAVGAAIAIGVIAWMATPHVIAVAACVVVIAIVTASLRTSAPTVIRHHRDTLRRFGSCRRRVYLSVDR